MERGRDRNICMEKEGGERGETHRERDILGGGVVFSRVAFLLFCKMIL